jgi:succinyl-CoA synthetase beta subunit
MARVKISEYRAKYIILGDEYKGVLIRSGTKTKLSKGNNLVVKVDQGVKKRFKQGLVAVDVSTLQAQAKFIEWGKKGFSQFILEPLISHQKEEEQYLSLERIREGVRILHTAGGGIDIEAHPEHVQTYIVTDRKDIQKIAYATKIPGAFLQHLFDVFNKAFFSFLEINPLIVRTEDVYLLDAACLVDSAGAFFTDAWNENDIVKSTAKHSAESRVEELAKTTPASLKLSVLNESGALFFLLSGGGGSIVIADEAQIEGAGDLISNYGEYSGGPTREETYLYAKEVIELVCASKAKRKALVIAGGVANFTDVQKTFAGIIDALSEAAPTLRKAEVKVFVRRGGPNEQAGLEHMYTFLESEKLLGSVYGSDTIITKAVEDAITFVRA